MKRILRILLCVSILLSTLAPAALAADTQKQEADGLNALGLFLGTGKGYELEKKLTRAQGVTLAVRALGKEKAAAKYSCTFADVNKDAAWAAGYVGYAYETGMTKGTSATAFSPNKTMTDYQFITFVLRILGYSDGAGRDFLWNDPYELAYGLHLISTKTADSSFTRGDAVSIFWNALKAPLKGSGKTLAGKLIDEGVFTLQQYSDAVKGNEYDPADPMDWELPGEYTKTDPYVPDQGNGGNTGSGTGEDSGSGTVTDPEPTEPTIKELTWAEYLKLTPEEAEEYMLSFPSKADFFDWRTRALAAYTGDDDVTVVEAGGTITI